MYTIQLQWVSSTTCYIAVLLWLINCPFDSMWTYCQGKWVRLMRLTQLILTDPMFTLRYAAFTLTRVRVRVSVCGFYFTSYCRHCSVWSVIISTQPCPLTICWSVITRHAAEWRAVPHYRRVRRPGPLTFKAGDVWPLSFWQLKIATLC